MNASKQYRKGKEKRKQGGNEGEARRKLRQCPFLYISTQCSRTKYVQKLWGSHDTVNDGSNKMMI